MKIKNDNTRENSFDFNFMLPTGKNWFSPKEVSKILGSSDQYVRNCIYSGKLFAHVTTRNTKAGSEPKAYIRIHRQGVEMYLLETANYTHETFIEKISKILSTRNNFELMRIEEEIKDILYSSAKNRKIIPNRW